MISPFKKTSITLVSLYILFLYGCVSSNTPLSKNGTASSVQLTSEVSVSAPEDGALNTTSTPTLERIAKKPTSTKAPTNSVIPELNGIMTTQIHTDQLSYPEHPVAGLKAEYLNDERIKELVNDSGAYWFRGMPLKWSEVEPVKGARNWDSIADFERELESATQLGLEVIIIIHSTPEWAQKIPGVYCGPIRQDRIPNFAAFMVEVVNRYSVPPYNVKYWELGNEPDVDPSLVTPDSLFGCWGDAEDEYYGGRYYAEMLKAVYPEIKSSDPDSNILIGGLVLDCDPINPPEQSPGSVTIKDCTSSRFIEGILKNDGGDYFDGISFHGYDYYNPPFGYGNFNWNSGWQGIEPVSNVKAEYLRTVLTDYGIEGKFLMNTEGALLCGRDGSEPLCKTIEFKITKANYVAVLNANALANGLRSSIWYSLFGWRGSGLMDARYRRELAFQAFRYGAEELTGAAFLKEIEQYPGVKGYDFYRNGERIWFLWSSNGEENRINLPTLPLEVHGVFGQSIEPSKELVISVEPLYVIWSH